MVQHTVMFLMVFLISVSSNVDAASTRRRPPGFPQGPRDHAPRGDDRSGCFAAEIRYRVAQHAENHRAVLARETLLERHEPAPHGFERWTDWLGGDDAFDADGRARLPP